MESQSSWLNLDTTQLYKPKHKSLNGVMVNLFLPPSLIPNAVRGGFSNEEKRFVIEFRYLSPSSSEPAQIVQSDDNLVVIHIDPGSGRVQKISIDVNKVSAQKIQLNVGQLVDSIKSTERKVQSSEGDWIKESLEVARTAVSLKKNELIAAFG